MQGKVKNFVTNTKRTRSLGNDLLNLKCTQPTDLLSTKFVHLESKQKLSKLQQTHFYIGKIKILLEQAIRFYTKIFLTGSCDLTSENFK